jgi:hypothetical protein
MADDSSEIVREQSESVAATNLKVLADGPAFYSNLAMKQAVEASAGWTNLNQAIVGKVAESIINTSPAEGSVDAAVLGQLAKLLQMTPPPTNIPTQGQ